MSTINPNPEPVKLVINFFYSEEEQLERALLRLSEEYGPIGNRMPPIPFDHTTYYDREMNGPLKKSMVCFTELVPRDSLADQKLFADQLEKELAEAAGTPGLRPVNIDPGHMSPEKLVLASGKNFAHRIYLGKGIFADLTLTYRQNRFEALPWTYSDYIVGAVLDFLGETREQLMHQLRDLRLDKAAS